MICENIIKFQVEVVLVTKTALEWEVLVTGEVVAVVEEGSVVEVEVTFAEGSFPLFKIF